MPERKTKTTTKKTTKKTIKKSPAKKPVSTKKKVKVTTHKSVPVENSEANVGDLGFSSTVDRQQIDTQKKFYQELSAELDQKYLEEDIPDSKDLKPATPKYKQPASINLYRRRATFFIALTILLLAAIFYFSFTKLTITITPAQEVVNNNVLLDVYSTDNTTEDMQALNGSVMSIEVSDERSYSATGEEVIGQEVTGQVEIINNYNKNQPLVATTRLLSPDDKLYRIKDTVDIPAGGSVTVDIYADEVSPDMAIAPTKFIIPGLWAGLQDKIYAQSLEAFTYQTKIEKYVKQSDLERAGQDIKQRLISQAKAEAERLFSDDYEIIYDLNEGQTVISSEAEVGDKIEDFAVSGKSQVVIIAFPRTAAEDLSRNKLSMLIPDDKELQEFDVQQLSYSLDNYNLKDGVATVKISFSGKMGLRSGSAIIDRAQLVNLNREQIENYLDGFPEIESYDLKFSPRFLNRAPRLVDRIKIE